MRPKAAMIFAAGFGTRMGDLTRAVPKPMVHVGGRPMIDHAVDLIEAAGAFEIVINTHYFAEQIHRHFATRANIHCLLETPTILDTGGGLRNALPSLGSSPVVTLNPDALWLGENPVRAIMNAWRPDQMDGLMAMVPTGRAQAYTGIGDFFLDQDQRPIRRGTAPDAPYVFGGLSILKTDGLEQMDQGVFGISRLWDQMSTAGRLFGTVIDTDWIDLGHPGGIEAANTYLTGGSDV